MDEILFEFLTLVNTRRDDKQIKFILKSLSSSQISKIRIFIRNVLNGRISLNDATYRDLSKHQFFLRQINTKFNVNNILKNYPAFSKILKIMLDKNGKCSESSRNTLQRMGRNESEKTKSINSCRFSTEKYNESRGGGEKYYNEQNDFKKRKQQEKPFKEEDDYEDKSYSSEEEDSTDSSSVKENVEQGEKQYTKYSAD